MIGFKFTHDKSAIFDPIRAKSVFMRDISSALDDIIEISRGQVYLRAPSGADQNLRNSIKTFTKSPYEKELTVGAKYGIVVEEGRRAAPVSRDADASLTRWILKSKKGQTYYRKIQQKYFKGKKKVDGSSILKTALFLLKRGKKLRPTKGQFYFKNGLIAAKKLSKPIYDNLMKKILTDVTA